MHPVTLRTARHGRSGSDVRAGGTWRDPYDGQVLHLDELSRPALAAAVTVDHLVPLEETYVIDLVHESAGESLAWCPPLEFARELLDVGPDALCVNNVPTFVETAALEAPIDT